MILLAVETSAAIASAALLRDGELVAFRQADSSRKHAETVMPLLRRILEEEGIRAAGIDALAVDIGPGSFTGVRIGVCAANGMALALNKPVIQVDSLRTLYEPYAEKKGRVCTLIDAGNANAYAAQFLDGECIVPPDAFVTERLLNSLPDGTCIVRDVMPRADWVALAGWHLRAAAQKAAAPLYVRPSQAERLYAERMGEAAE